MIHDTFCDVLLRYNRAWRSLLCYIITKDITVQSLQGNRFGNKVSSSFNVVFVSVFPSLNTFIDIFKIRIE